MAVPSAPTNLVAAVTAPAYVSLTWTDSSSDEDGFRVERKETSGSTWGSVAEVLADATSYIDNTATPDVSFDYQVIAFNGDGDSTASNTETVTTPIPSIISLSPPPTSSTTPRNTLASTEISYLSSGIYGQERNPDGSLSGSKF